MNNYFQLIEQITESIKSQSSISEFVCRDLVS